MTEYKLKELTKIVTDLVNHSGENHLFVLEVLEKSELLTIEESEMINERMSK